MVTPRERKKANPTTNVDDFNKVIIKATLTNLALSANKIRTPEEKVEYDKLVLMFKELLKNAK